MSTDNHLTPCSSDLLYSRRDPSDPRIGEWVKQECPTQSPQEPTFSLLGYPDDEGISLNKGRTGASEGPNAIRQSLYRMTPALESQSKIHIYDLGNLLVNPSGLAERHEKAESHVSKALGLGSQVMTLGGGHDYAYPDVSAFLNHCQNSSSTRPLVVNFDAHLDVRPTDKGLSSGTPFFRVLEKYSDFDFLQVGIQSHCNSKRHYEYCAEKGARIIDAEDLLYSAEPLSRQLLKKAEDWILRKRPCFISIDIDGFSNAFAMGCSQSWATGFTPQDFFPCFEILLRRMDVLGVGIYEVSPPLDLDNKTSKLAAQILHHYIFTRSEVLRRKP